MSAIYAWSSTFCNSIDELSDSDGHLQESVEGIKRLLIGKCGKSEVVNSSTKLTDFLGTIDISHIGNVNTADLDAIFSTCYFWMQMEIMRAHTEEIDDVLAFVSQLVRALTQQGLHLIGVHARVATWIAVLDARASLFGGCCGKFMDLICEIGLVEAMWISWDVLKQEYFMVYPPEIEQEDRYHLQLLATF